MIFRKIILVLIFSLSTFSTHANYFQYATFVEIKYQAEENKKGILITFKTDPGGSKVGFSDSSENRKFEKVAYLDYSLTQSGENLKILIQYTY